MFLHRRQQWNILFLLSGTLRLIRLPQKHFTRMTYVRKFLRPQFVSCLLTLNRTVSTVSRAAYSKLDCQGLNVRLTSNNLLRCLHKLSARWCVITEILSQFPFLLSADSNKPVWAENLKKVFNYENTFVLVNSFHLSSCNDSKLVLNLEELVDNFSDMLMSCIQF